MANTYTQCYIHLVFAVKYREAFIRRQWKDGLEKYITGIVQNNKHKLIAISCMPDHVHIFIGYYPNQLIPDLVEKIKTSSDEWIQDRKLTKHVFHWQKGYGAFTHSRSNISRVATYIENQERHHKNKTFRDEYLDILDKNGVEYDKKYLFEFFNLNDTDLSGCC